MAIAMSSASNGETASDLLDQLITQGLAPNNQDLYKIRQLIIILFQACILQPLSEVFTPESLRRARDTLRILHHHASSRPELLSLPSPQPADNIPLFKVLLPRIIYASVKYAGREAAERLPEELLEAGSGILRAMCRQMQENGSGCVKGRYAAIMAAKALQAFSHAALESTVIILYGFTELIPDYSTAIAACRIVLSSRMSFVDDVRRDLLRMLNTMSARSEKLDIPTKISITSALLAELDFQSNSVQLEPTLKSVLSWNLDSQYQEDLFRTLKGYPYLQLAAWRSISESAGDLNLQDHKDAVRARYLLQPFPPHLSAVTISAILAECISTWTTQMEQSGVPGDIADSLRVLSGEEEVSRKRKRSTETDEKVIELCRPVAGIKWREGGDLFESLSDSLDSLSTDNKVRLHAALPGLCCAYCECMGDHASAVRKLPLLALPIWLRLLGSHAPSPAQIRCLILLLRHSDHAALAASPALSKARDKTLPLLQDCGRTIRLLAGHVAVSLISIYSNSSAPNPHRRRSAVVLSRLQTSLLDSGPVRSTAIAACGAIARAADDEILGEVLELLISQLGARHPPIVALAYSELLAVAAYREKTPYTLISPHLERISTLLAANVLDNRALVSQAMLLLGTNRQNFFQMTLRFAIPAMVIKRDLKALEEIAGIVQETLGVMMLDGASVALAKIFLLPKGYTAALDFLVHTVRAQTSQSANTNVTVQSLMTSCIVNLVVSLIIELGDDEVAVQDQALLALQRAYQTQTSARELTPNLGPFLKPHMLGIISHLNDCLHDMAGRKTVAYKQKVIRSLGKLIETVGDSMSAFSPQIIASLQGTLGVPEFRAVTLSTWKVFIGRLRYADSGPFIGRTSAAIVANWADFDENDRKQAASMITEIADNAQQLLPYLDEIVDMNHIPELEKASTVLTSQRRQWSFRKQAERMLERMRSKNPAVSVTAITEMRKFLLDRTAMGDLARITQGDIFDPLATMLVQGLLAAVVRDGEAEELKTIGYECLGLIGALDPDRLQKLSETPSMLIMSNFSDEEESAAFAIHLIRDLLVYAFQATNDTKYQNHLAYAIQELLKFCGFTTKIIQPGTAQQITLKVRSRWNLIPQDQYETLTPLLESRFTLTESASRHHEHPIYKHCKSYREWIQSWSSDLLGQVAAMQSAHQLSSQRIFGVMRPVLRNQDVTVAHHILPHLVLHVLLSGDKSALAEISSEINTVLHDQVNPSGPSDKRVLSAQVIFDLMDHLSKWLRVARSNKSDRTTHCRTVEAVLTSVETELLANAALQSKAYARSLRNFEQRIVQLKREKRENSELQTYYERLHEIYADLDEPDGMEGVSTFVIAPSLEHQIREHESTGRWTSAQSCWEVRLQQSPEDLALHEGLLRCLRNLGHYDTLRTHIRGILSRHPQWAESLASFEAEAAWIIGDWSTVQKIAESGHAMARVMCALQQKQLGSTIAEARWDIGKQIASTHYSRAYESILHLHILRELEEIEMASKAIDRGSQAAHTARQLHSSLDWRFAFAAPAFRTREAILSARRTAFSVLKTSALQQDIGKAWVLSSKMARKAGYDQTAYSAVLQARETDAPFGFVQQAKLSRTRGGALKALTELENSLAPLLKAGEVIDLSRDDDKDLKTDERFLKDRNLAKAVLLEARWMHESDRFTPNEIITKYTQASQLAQDLESPYYHLGHYYDNRPGPPEHRALFNYFTCYHYVQALKHGVKYIYRTMPRTLTIWLDLGDTIKEKEKDKKNPINPETVRQLDRITVLMDKSRKELPTYEFLTAFPQIASRLGHKHENIRPVLIKVMATVLVLFPQQALWPMVYLMQSNRPERRDLCLRVTQRVSQTAQHLTTLIKDAERFSGHLLKLCNEKVEDKRKECSINTHYPYMRQAIPTRMMVPLQDALTGSLPSSAQTLHTHNPFPVAPVEIHSIDDRIEIMQSLQKPKKIVFTSSNGHRYPFLCKPHDDLRKDARLMDFNSMINKLLKSASESRRRQLYIRTYAVMPLNEECGLLEWVTNTNALKNILEAGYARYGKKIYTHDLANILEKGRKDGPARQIDDFVTKIIPMFAPTVFVDWFLMTWPEPSAWLTSRMNYCRTLAVMSMIGYVLGLGDRHGENILFDGLTGDTVHVDLNCLFDKGKTFEIPERVPFRLTQNMVEAMGVTGVEGVFRKAAEITMEVLRTNSESLMSVLEAFVHDPLVEWTKGSRSKSEKEIRASADRNLKPIKTKLKGMSDDGFVSTVPNHVETLIQQATTPKNLALMYQGWTPWL